MPNSSSDVPCLFKLHVDGIKSRAYLAIQEAAAANEAPEVITGLGEVLTACNEALKHVRRTRGYAGGRLEASASEVATTATRAFLEKHPRFEKIFYPEA